MQSWVLDYDFNKSAYFLDRNRLMANIYENIHGLSSLLEINDKLVNPKRSVANHPNVKRWKNYLSTYFYYICVHLDEWYRRGYTSSINKKNMDIIWGFNNPKILIDVYQSNYKIPDWVTNELILDHQGILLKKCPDYYKRYFME